MILRRVIKILTAIFDQGLYSGINFVLTILLARWMFADAFGVYSYVSTFYLLLFNFHSSLIVEPMSIFAHSRYKLEVNEYIRKTNNIHWFYTFAISLIILFIGLFISLVSNNVGLVKAVIGLGFAQGMILVFLLSRRINYINKKIYLGIIQSLISAIVLISSISLLKYYNAIDPLNVFLVVGVSSLTPYLIFFKTYYAGHSAILNYRQIWTENWKYGKWLILSTIISWLAGNSYQVITANIMSFSDVAALKALQNLIAPILQVTSAIGIFFLPWLSEKYTEQGRVGLVKGIWIYTIMTTSLTVGYMLIMWGASDFIYNSAYKGKYSETSWLLPYLCLWPVIAALSSGWLMGLRILEKTAVFVWIDALGAILSVTIGLALVSKFGIKGAVATALLSYGCRLLIIPKLYRSYFAASC